MGRILMAVNVTQKDQTLTEIIDFCEDVMSVWCRLEGAHARGYREALADVIAHCRDSLGYSGVMRGREAEPCEEQVEAATVERSRHQILFSIDGIRKCCSCGAVVGGAWGDSRVAFERHVTMMMLEAARKAVM